MLDSHNRRVKVLIMKPRIACVYAGLFLGWTLTWAQSPNNGSVLARVERTMMLERTEE
jgi:hypothetical protein